jgi:hypothetical protein
LKSKFFNTSRATFETVEINFWKASVKIFKIKTFSIQALVQTIQMVETSDRKLSVSVLVFGQNFGFQMHFGFGFGINLLVSAQNQTENLTD